MATFVMIYLPLAALLCPRFRMRQVNIVGTSPPSQPSRKIETLQAPPDISPANVTLRTASETSLWLRWVVSCHGLLYTWPQPVCMSLVQICKTIIWFWLCVPWLLPLHPFASMSVFFSVPLIAMVENHFGIKFRFKIKSDLGNLI